MILGLDISTSSTGWCVVSPEGKLVDMGVIRLPSSKTLFEKAKIAKVELQSIAKKHNINMLIVEENLQGFRRGFSSARTLVTLARFNGILSYIAGEIFGIEPQFLSVVTTRKQLGMKMQREKVCGVSTKQQVLNWVTEKLSDTNWQWPNKTLKSGPRKGQSILDPVAYDMADAYVMALAGHLNIAKSID